MTPPRYSFISGLREGLQMVVWSSFMMRGDRFMIVLTSAMCACLLLSSFEQIRRLWPCLARAVRHTWRVSRLAGRPMIHVDRAVQRRGCPRTLRASTGSESTWDDTPRFALSSRDMSGHTFNCACWCYCPVDRVPWCGLLIGGMKGRMLAHTRECNELISRNHDFLRKSGCADEGFTNRIWAKPRHHKKSIHGGSSYIPRGNMPQKSRKQTHLGVQEGDLYGSSQEM